jgi:phosphohistidine swiveling domain-containing protein
MADVLDGDWDLRAHWSRTNLSEAMPDVLTPLSWTVWQPTFERAMRGGFAAIGALERSEAGLPADPHDAMYAIFHGRAAAKVEFLGAMGDRLPGTSGAAIAEQFFGTLPPGFTSRSTLRRLPAVALGFPAAVWRSPRRVRAVHAETADWWTGQLRRVPTLDLVEARAAWAEALTQFEKAFASHIVVTLACVQPIFDQVGRLAAAAGHPDLAGPLVAGQGSHVEVAMIEDLWTISRGEGTLDEFLAGHGYHGPREGEISARVWREESRPLKSLIEQYRAMPADVSPLEVASQRAREAQQARTTVLAALPRRRRAAGTLVLRAADRFIGLRGVGKAAFVQALDGARMTARRIGAHLAEAGALADPEDVFLLTASEVAHAPSGVSLHDLVEERRAERDRCLQLRLPISWYGRPEPVVAVGADETDLRLRGVGASAGVVEGPVRVVTEPDCDDLEPGEILVAPYTDPAWAAIMFVSAGLIVDIGGPLSHAAVVARELGIPCVIGISDATTRLRTGDVCRVDGHAGTVEVLHRSDR